MYFFLIFIALCFTPPAVFLIRFLPHYLYHQNKLACKSSRLASKPNLVLHKDIYIIIYVLSLIIFSFIYFLFPANLHSYLLMFFCWIVLILTVIDFYTFYLPDIITLPMIWLGLLKEFFESTQFIGMNQAVIGAALSYIFFRVLSEVFFLIRKKEPLGRGDMKFFSMIGAWFGLEATLFSLLLSSIAVCVWQAIKLFILKSKKKNTSQYFPFGPWIGFAVFIYIILSH